MTNNNQYCVILAGGIGTRLWPSSRKEKPKQFIDILGTGETLLQTTYKRICRFMPKENIFVITNIDYEDILHEQLPDVSKQNILLEPMRRNTVPSTTWATFHILSQNMNASIVFTPSDHIITEENLYEEDIIDGLEYVAKEKKLLSMGMMPSHPDTNFGYIQMGSEESKGIFKVKSFSEKPELEFAKMLHQSGEFLWNTGIFIVDGKTYIDTIAYASNSFQEMFDKVKELVAEHKEIDKFIEDTYARCPNTTLEQSLLEKAINVDVKLCRFGWKDVGSWGELYNICQKTEDGNVIIADQPMLYNCENCLVKLPQGTILVAQDLKDYLIVEDNGILVICKKDNQQTIRKFVNDYDLKKY